VLINRYVNGRDGVAWHSVRSITLSVVNLNSLLLPNTHSLLNGRDGVGWHSVRSITPSVVILSISTRPCFQTLHSLFLSFLTTRNPNFRFDHSMTIASVSCHTPRSR
jgi:hypothetical protein